MRVDQYLPDFGFRDAIATHAHLTRRVLRDAGYESDIWADVIHPVRSREARSYRQPGSADRGGVLLYHASTASPMAGWLAGRARAGARLWVYYHNITPARFFARWDPGAAAGAERARTELAALAPVSELAMAASAYNRAELEAAGFTRTVLSPLLLDPDRPPAGHQEGKGGARWLFVGRLAPNKCQHDVIGAFAAYRKGCDPSARLTLVGSPVFPRYLRALQQLVGELELDGSVELAGSVDAGGLRARYAAADVFVSCSEHEGFGVPLIEAMAGGVPVVAYGAAAVPETVGDGGVVLADKDPATVAGAVDSVLRDADRYRQLVAAGRRRAATFALDRTAATLLAHVRAQLGE